ncbi:MAG: hypothetical protein GF368_05330 [Candidatus Aenigmarchaeota archaeon]|nr:hypothetical protein [Candidatus Aenigmarchaeota archaeon]
MKAKKMGDTLDDFMGEPEDEIPYIPGINRLYSGSDRCSTCDGMAYVTIRTERTPLPLGTFKNIKECPVCHGTGRK